MAAGGEVSRETVARVCLGECKSVSRNSRRHRVGDREPSGGSSGAEAEFWVAAIGDTRERS